jgi:hypothetical protein
VTHSWGGVQILTLDDKLHTLSQRPLKNGFAACEPFLQSAHNVNGPGRRQGRSLENCFAQSLKMVQKASQALDIATTPGACQEKKGPQDEKGQNNKPII